MNVKTGDEFLAGTINKLTGTVWTPWLSEFSNGKGSVEWMRDNLGGRREKESSVFDHFTSWYWNVQDINLQVAMTRKAFHEGWQRCVGVLLISYVQVKYLSRSDLVKWHSAHGQMVKPLTRLEIQPISRFGVNRKYCTVLCEQHHGCHSPAG